MEVCSKNPNRTAPVADDGLQGASVPLCSRTNGWTWPPHPFQLLAWLLYVFFAITGFGVFVPLLPPHWIPAGYIVSLQDALSIIMTWLKVLLFSLFKLVLLVTVLSVETNPT